MKPRNPLFVVLAGVLMLGLLASSAAAARGRRSGALASASVDGGNLTFSLNAPFEKAVVTVAGPEKFRLRQEFKAGQPVAVALRGDTGGALADGRYRYSLRVTSQRAGAGVKAGIFFVRNGKLVSRTSKRSELAAIRADLNETRAARPDGDPQAYSTDYYVAITPSYIYVGSPYYTNYYYNYVRLTLYNYDQFPGSPYSVDYPSWDIYNYYGYFTIQTFDNPYATVYDALAIDWYGKVGVGTRYPTADLEVYDYNDYAALRLNNYNANWAFSNTPGGVFTVNKIGSGGQEFSVRPRLDAAGNTMQVQGSVQGTKFVSSSSRDLKTDFTALDGKKVLEQLSELPVMSWRYKTDEESERHIGPVAEDFQAAFQLGDSKTIANIDADGVALAAIQGLRALLREKAAALEELRTEKDRQIAALARRLAALEERHRGEPSAGR